MLNIHAMTAAEVPAFIAERCTLLCKSDSQMQRLFDRIASGDLHENERGWMIAYAWLAPAMEDDVTLVGWCSVTEWQCDGSLRMAVQAFVLPDYRRRGIATAMCVCLAHDMPTHTSPVAVFSDECMRIARHLGWRADQYKQVEDGWIGVATFEGRSGRGGADEG